MVLTSARARVLRRRGFLLEGATLAWNVVGVVVLALLAIRTGSVAVAGFGLDSLIEIGASVVVIWELSDTGERRRRRALRLIALAFAALALSLAVTSVGALVTLHRPGVAVGGIAWTAVTALVMFALAAGKAGTGRALANPVLLAESRVTVVDGILAIAVLLGLLLTALLGWWWADALAGLVIVGYAVREALHLLHETRGTLGAPAARGSGKRTPGRTCEHLRMDADTRRCGRLPDSQYVELAVEVFSLLADATRVRIVLALRDAEELAVNALAEIVDRPASTVSQHLAKMRMARLVTTRQDGQRVFYKLADEHAVQLVTDAIFQAEHSVGNNPRHHHAAAAAGDVASGQGAS